MLYRADAIYLTKEHAFQKIGSWKCTRNILQVMLQIALTGRIKWTEVTGRKVNKPGEARERESVCRCQKSTQIEISDSVLPSCWLQRIGLFTFWCLREWRIWCWCIFQIGPSPQKFAPDGIRKCRYNHVISAFIKSTQSFSKYIPGNNWIMRSSWRLESESAYCSAELVTKAKEKC